MKLKHVVNIEDLHRIARRRVAKVAFDYFEGGVEDEAGLSRNAQAFKRRQFVPRFLVDVSRVNQTTELFGRSYASPFGIAPTGVGDLLRPGADLMLAQAAAEANIPYTLSGLSTTRLEDVAAIAPEHAWFQLYGARDRRISEDMIRRARDAGYQTLVFTVDVPVLSKREREMHSRMGQPDMPLWTYLEALLHPAWLLGYLRNGMPRFKNYAPYTQEGRNSKALVKFIGTQFPVADHTWNDVENFRRLWPGNLVLKGILHPDDAVRAAEAGVDGVIVSNHGARQLDSAPSSLDAVPGIAAAAGERLTVMLDSGVRRGVDILMALALGARFVFTGRATLYGVGAFGLPGARKAIEILQREVEINMMQLGCTSLDRLGPQYLIGPAQAEAQVPTPR